jgi:hypothetical protein
MKTKQPATPKLQGGFGAVRNIVPVIAGELVIGEMHINRRSGWRGGPSYQFYPNFEGTTLGLKSLRGPSTRALLRQLGEE